MSSSYGRRKRGKKSKSSSSSRKSSHRKHSSHRNDEHSSIKRRKRRSKSKDTRSGDRDGSRDRNSKYSSDRRRLDVGPNSNRNIITPLSTRHQNSNLHNRPGSHGFNSYNKSSQENSATKPYESKTKKKINWIFWIFIVIIVILVLVVVYFQFFRPSDSEETPSLDSVKDPINNIIAARSAAKVANGISSEEIFMPSPPIIRNSFKSSSVSSSPVEGSVVDKVRISGKSLQPTRYAKIKGSNSVLGSPLVSRSSNKKKLIPGNYVRTGETFLYKRT